MQSSMKQEAVDHFQSADPVMYSLAKNVLVEDIKPRLPHRYFVGLCTEIIGQQLSGRVADIIFARFRQLFLPKRVTPHDTLRLSDEALRGTGMSWSKTRFIKDLAQKVVTKSIQLHQLAQLTDQEVIKELTKIKGIGPWTAEMFLMFTLGREDVFSCGDLGLRKAVKKFYGLRHEPSPQKLSRMSIKWSPYRTWAARILWKSLV